MERSTRLWVWTILRIGVGLAWLLPGDGIAATQNHLATLGIALIEPPREATPPGMRGTRR